MLNIEANAFKRVCVPTRTKEEVDILKVVGRTPKERDRMKEKKGDIEMKMKDFESEAIYN
jgi:hypothetical protein